MRTQVFDSNIGGSFTIIIEKSHSQNCWTRKSSIKLGKYIYIYFLHYRKMNLQHLPVTKMKVKVKVSQLSLTLCNPMDCSLPGFSIHGILQARILEWIAIPFFRRYSFFFNFILFLNFTILYWFCQISKWIRHRSPQSPKDCSIHQCLFCCLIYRVIVTIFLNSIYLC